MTTTTYAPAVAAAGLRKFYGDKIAPASCHQRQNAEKTAAKKAANHYPGYAGPCC